MKIYINEKKLNLLTENNTPDCVVFGFKNLYYDDNQAYPFGIYHNELIVGGASETHNYMLKEHVIHWFEREGKEYYDDYLEDDDDDDYLEEDDGYLEDTNVYDDTIFTDDDIKDRISYMKKNRHSEGRIWIRSKIIAFWDSISKENLITILNEVSKLLQINLNDFNIALSNTIIPLDEYLVTQSQDVDKERIVHNLPSDKKKESPQMKNAMNTVNSIKGKKFGEPNNNRSVPEAEYNFYKRYGMGEGIEPKKVRQGIIPYESDEFTLGTKGDDGIAYGVSENMDLEVNSDKVNLSSFKKEKTLNPKLWYQERLNPKIRLRLLDIADDFWDSLETSWVKIKDIIITGSISNYNWSKYSDIDLHIVIDYKEVNDNLEFVKDYFDSKKNEWNESHTNLKMYGFPVEIYVQDINEVHESSGIYSIEKNKWIIKPNPHKLKELGLDKYTIKEKSAKIMTLIDNLEDKYISSKDNHVINDIANKVKLLLVKLKGMRKSSLENDGENGVGNVIWKVLRRTNYLDKLYKLKINTYDKINTLS